MFCDPKKCFDGYTYYGSNYSRVAIDLTGKLVPWEPMNSVDNPDQTQKTNKSNIKSSDDNDIEYFVNENGLTKRAFAEWSQEKK
ncbi:MAG: hypothetical protein LBE09_03900 [Christensenellaceae bacterium]|jgi:hypothetical protein|nr:hypothetical protein [Christensenellaceae bacterium]